MSERVPARAGPRPSGIPDDVPIVGCWGPQAWIDRYEHQFPSRIRLPTDPRRLSRALPRCDVVVAMAPDLADPDAAQLLRTLEHLAGSPPTVLCTTEDTENLANLVQLRADALFLFEQPEEELADLVSRIHRERDLVRAAVEILPPLDSLPSTVLARGLRLLFDEARAFATAESLTDAPCWSFRKVKALARTLGCEPHHLSRNASLAGFHLGALIRWMTFLVALQQHRRGRNTWTAIAGSLGFGDASDWNGFVKRLTGMTPTKVEEQESMGWWKERFRASVLIPPP